MIDIAAALTLLLTRSRAVVLWMVQWGFFTALLRVTAYGPGALGEVIVRMPHAPLPLVLLPFTERLHTSDRAPTSLFAARSQTPARQHVESRN